MFVFVGRLSSMPWSTARWSSRWCWHM